MKDEYQSLDKNSMIKLVNEADSAEMSTNTDKQLEITKFMDHELKKVNDKVATLKYVRIFVIMGRLCSPKS